ncbi:MAG: polysaccharide deacetylase family protein [Muribaculum sp.]|nr:polysaccharide deacetylase family protein [Muribaculum sp.]
MIRIPKILRLFAFRRDVLFRLWSEKPSVYLTFDDGPIPESTPHLLSMLKESEAKATFFMVADNARKYPALLKAVKDTGHAVGNHTFHHRPPYKDSKETLMADVALADTYLHSQLFRPPHGLMWPSQQKALADAGYKVVMFDLNTLDYRPDQTADMIVDIVSRYVRPGCIINFHDSLKSIDKLRVALPPILRMLKERGYALEALPSTGSH